MLRTFIQDVGMNDHRPRLERRLNELVKHVYLANLQFGYLLQLFREEVDGGKVDPVEMSPLKVLHKSALHVLRRRRNVTYSTTRPHLSVIH